MEPISTAALLGITAGLGAAKGVAGGISTRRQAKAMELTPEEERELRRIRQQRRNGGLGLTGSQRGLMEQRFLAEQAGATRELEAQALQQAAARGLGGGVSGRDIFLQEQAGQLAQRGIRQEQNVLLAQAEEQARQEQLARLNELTAKQQQAEAMKRAGTMQAITGGLAAGADVAAQAAMMQHQTQLAEAAVPKQTDQSLLNMYYGGQPTPNFGGLLPPPTFQ